MSKFNIYRIGKESSQYEIFKNNKLGEGTYSSVCMGRAICSNIGVIGTTSLPKATIIRPLLNSDTAKEQTVAIPINYSSTYQTEKLVAVKKIVKSSLSTRGLTMLTSEIEIIKETITHDHSNIVKCYDVIDDIDVIYIVMEYCENGDLSGLLKKKQMKYEFIKYYFGQIINALKYLHDNNIIHRDIKPKNILITNNYRTVKLCDFGFARHFSGIKKVMTMCGSPLYMAPEIYQKIGYSQSVDVWSLGLILYEMIYGYHPLEHCNDPKKLAHSVMTTDIDIPLIYNVDNIYNFEGPIELLKLMLQRTEQDRINTSELFKNNWVLECTNTVMTDDMYNDIHTLNIYTNSTNSSSQSLPIMLDSTQNISNTLIFQQNKQFLSNSCNEKEFDCTFTMDD